MTKDEIMSLEPEQTCPNINGLQSEIRDLERYISKKERYADNEEAKEILSDISNMIYNWERDLEDIRKQNIALRDWGNLCLDNVELKTKEL